MLCRARPLAYRDCGNSTLADQHTRHWMQVSLIASGATLILSYTIASGRLALSTRVSATRVEHKHLLLLRWQTRRGSIPHLAASSAADPVLLCTVPFTPSQGIATPSPTNVAAMWYSQYSPHLFPQPGTPGHPYAVVWGPVCPC